jgi:hypothetical protein
MKNGILSIVVLICISGYSQSSPEILIGADNIYVAKYMDSLFSLRKNSAYKIKQSTDKNGNLEYKAEYAISDESFYGCLSNTATFTRVKGVEICTSQMIFGGTEYAARTLNWIKDNFMKVDTNKWETPYPDNPEKVKIVANYSQIGTDNFVIVVHVSYIKP